ncbi:MAG: DUF4167 domain-containing protein [Alphaproteobacteria bacterium]|nr:DUF4167 domain-containing protein [Alphaproteobacteria bacterium]
MRQGQSAKRSRGRSGGRRNGSPRHQSFDSNGPSIRIRGNAHQVYEKYIQLARDANAAGDRITAENMYQHAEHYFRIMNVEEGESQQQRQQNQQNQQNRNNGADPRSQPRNGQHAQDNVPAGIDAGSVADQPTSNENAGPNGSGENRAARGNGDAAAQGNTEESHASSGETVAERAPRRPRRSTNRPRARAGAEAGEAAEAPVVVEPKAEVESKAEIEPEAVVEAVTVEVDAKDV